MPNKDFKELGFSNSMKQCKRSFDLYTYREQKKTNIIN